MKHPSGLQLAMYSGADLQGIERFRVAWHLLHCKQCQAEVNAFREACANLRAELNELPQGLSWEPLESEMTGNIRVGLAAGECIAQVVKRNRQPRWRAAAVLASATLMLVAAWWLNLPRQPLSTVGVVLQSTPSGIEMQQNGAALELLHRTGSQTIYVSAPRSLRSRSVDAETGQVTIYNLYAD